MRKNVKEPLMERRLIVNMRFESIAEREAAYGFLNSEGGARLLFRLMQSGRL